MAEAPTIRFDAKNADQLSAWDGAEGRRWTEHATRYDAACGRFDRWLLEAAAIGETDRVLDIGCGCGVSTREAARRARRGSVLGLDLSRPMLERAAELAREEGLANVSFEQADAQIHPFEEGSFTTALSRFGCMFFGDPVTAFANVRRSLRPGGRLALLTWRPLADNEWVFALRTALAAGRSLPERPSGLPGPFGMAEAGPVQQILGAAGFHGVELTPVNEPVLLGRDADDAFAYVSSMGIAVALLDGLGPDLRARALDDLRRMLESRATREGVHLAGSAWLISARR